MTCPASSVTIEKSKFGMGVQVTVDISNESFATWGGDVGSAAAAFAAVTVRFDSPRDGLNKKIIEQGFEMGRPSFIELSMMVKQGKLETVRIGGQAVRVSDGEIEI